MIDRAAWPFTGLKPRARIHRRGPPPGLPSSVNKCRRSAGHGGKRSSSQCQRLYAGERAVSK
jgi:hypothetical protein